VGFVDTSNKWSHDPYSKVHMGSRATLLIEKMIPSSQSYIIRRPYKPKINK